jgi:tetratricopeptide (TPR) repeat protein
MPVLLGASLLHSAQQPPPPKTPATAPSAPLPPEEDAPAAAKPPVQQAKASTAAAPDSDLPPDEDAATSGQETYSFNPLKAKKAIDIGTTYFKKGDYRAAASRYREATKWNEGNTDAWLWLGKAEEKRGQKNAAKSAYEKYLQLAGNSKNAGEVRKKLEKLQ